ncbi:MAG: hypothetical protein HGA19_07320 [Oscillochloris sp.]|nr:hypothetical protein [Oscillochloris sp.]
MKVDYTSATSLTQALKVCRYQIERLGKREILPLLGDEAVRAAIFTGVKSYDALLPYNCHNTGYYTYGSHFKQQRTRFRQLIRPIYLSIAEQNAWPTGSSFEVYTSVSDITDMTYEGFLLRLVITASDNGFGFALPILDISYGRCLPVIDELPFDLEQEE